MDKRYLGMAEVAVMLKLEQFDLLSYGIEGHIPIGVLAYGGIKSASLPDSFMVREDEEGNRIEGDTPDWIIMLMPKTLRAIAEDGKASSGRGYRWHDEEWEPVGVTSENGITLSDLIVPVSAVKELTQKHEQPITQPETPVSPEGKETFQKQVAGLALVIHQQSKVSKGWGNNPNKSQIAKAVMDTIDTLPKELHATLNLTGIGGGVIRQNIAKGLQLLGFAEEDSST